MGKIPYGVPNRHVQASKGGDTDVMKFYCTQVGYMLIESFRLPSLYHDTSYMNCINCVV